MDEEEGEGGDVERLLLLEMTTQVRERAEVREHQLVTEAREGGANWQMEIRERQTLEGLKQTNKTSSRLPDSEMLRERRTRAPTV